MNSSTKPAKVLVVDEDPLNLELTARALASAGFVIRMAANGEEAVTWIGMEQFAAVVTDVRMPRMDGLELLRNIRGRLPWLPVVIMTGSVENDIRATASAWGAAAVFEKPVRRGELIAAIKVALADLALPFAPVFAPEAESAAVAAA